MAKNIIVFDLDATVINSSHRTPNFPDGTLNLDLYRKMRSFHSVFCDSLLPLANVMRSRKNAGDYIVILTAREMQWYDYAYLMANGLPYDKCLSREKAKPEHSALHDGDYKRQWVEKSLKPLARLKQFQGAQIVMFEDAGPVKEKLREFFPVICAHKINKKLTQTRRISV